MLLPPPWKELLKDTFTRRWARFVYESDVRKDTVESWSGEREVYWVNSESSAKGQAVPIGTIILNERHLSNSKEEVLMQVVEHEIGHLVSNPVTRGLLYGLVSWIPFGSLYLLNALGYSLVIPFGLSVAPGARFAGGAILMIVVGVMAIRGEEIYADFHVLKYVTYEDYLSAYDSLREGEPGSAIARIHVKLFYTNPETIVRLHKTMDQIRTRRSVI